MQQPHNGAPAPWSFLALEHLEKSFTGAKKTAKVVNDVNLNFERGEFITILGPSGCGKTTLLNLISGIERPDAGKILLEGEDITGIAPEYRNFGMVWAAGKDYADFMAKGDKAMGEAMKSAGLAKS